MQPSGWFQRLVGVSFHRPYLPMRLFTLTLTLILLSIAFPAKAWQLSGTVRDLQGETLPYANVYVENTTYGVVTNLKGQYFFELKDGTYNVVFSLLGYEKKVVPVNIKGKNLTLDVTLEEEDLEMNAVEITETRRDPAYAIMDSVAAHKWEYIKQYETFTSEIYLKASLESDTLKKPGEDKPLTAEDSAKLARKDSIEAQRQAEREAKIAERQEKEGKDSTDTGAGTPKEDAYGDLPRPKLNFIEYFATVCFAQPERYKSIIHAWRDFTQKSTGSVQVSFGDSESRSGSPSSLASNPYLFYLDVADADFNFYRNLIEIPDLSVRPFVSPASTNGALYYKYKLVQSFMEDGKVVHEIEVTPRNIAAPLFTGTMFIMEKSWAIKAVNLRLNPDAIYFFKYFQVIQDHSILEGDGRWVMDREEFFYNTREGRIRYYGNTVVKYSDYVLDTAFSRNFFHNEVRRMDDDALEKDSLFWNESRPIALKPEEDRFIHTQDSINDILTSAKYMAEQDSAFNRLSVWDFLLNGVGFKNSFKKREIFFNPLVAQVRPLGVGGYRHAFGGSYEKEWDRAHGIDVNYELDYGVVNQDLKGWGRVSYTYLPKHFGKVYVRGGNVFSMVNTNPSFTASFSRGNYVQKYFGGIGHRIEVVNGVQLDVAAEWADRRSLENLDLEEWSNTLFGGLNTPVAFDPYKEFLLKVSVEFTPFQKYAIEPYKKVNLGSAWPTITFNYKKAIPNIYGSAIDYDFLEVVSSHKLKIGNIGESRWRFNAGTYLTSDSVQFTDYKFFRGSDKFYFSDPLQSFQLLGPTLSTKNPFLMANYLHNFNGLFLNKVPFIRKLKMEEIAGAGTLLIPDQSFQHVEVFAGVTLPFRIKRQMFKVGAYFVTSYSNVAQLSASVKFGINFFDSQANSWIY
jgi:hypothetical protein